MKIDEWMDHDAETVRMVEELMREREAVADEFHPDAVCTGVMK